MSTPSLSRREWLQLSAAGVLGGCLSGWMEALAEAAAPPVSRQRSCILLWMSGGPSQTDTFDLKPGHANGGPFKEIATAVPGIRISEHLPRIAKFANKMGIVRSLTTKEGDHGRASYLMHTGRLPQGPIAYPTLGSLMSRELGRNDAPLPNFVSIAPYRQFNADAYGPGFLGPAHAPLIIAENGTGNIPVRTDYADALKVRDLAPAGNVPAAHLASRIDLLRDLSKGFAAGRPDTPAKSHQNAVERAVRLMRTSAGKAFNLDEETDRMRDAYGRNLFGQGCLLARRLVERGVPFIEVSLAGNNGGFGWDTHNNNFEQVKQLSAMLDPAWGTLMQDLDDRGLLSSTLIVWMGEFGRTPAINPGNGRDHFTNAWSAVLAGGGIKGGQVHGKTSKDGMMIEANPVTVPDLLATVCRGIGVDPEKPNMSNGRPIRIVEKGGKPIAELVG